MNKIVATLGAAALLLAAGQASATDVVNFADGNTALAAAGISAAAIGAAVALSDSSTNATVTSSATGGSTSGSAK